MASDEKDDQALSKNLENNDGAQSKDKDLEHKSFTQSDAFPESNKLVSNTETTLPQSKEKSNVEIDWDHDSKNPYNWPMRKRVYHTILTGTFGLVMYVR